MWHGSSGPLVARKRPSNLRKDRGAPPGPPEIHQEMGTVVRTTKLAYTEKVRQSQSENSPMSRLLAEPPGITENFKAEGSWLEHPIFGRTSSQNKIKF